MTGTSGLELISTRQRKLAELAQQDPQLELTTIAHHIDSVWLREAYCCLSRRSTTRFPVYS